jgi:hypothetical protein
MSRIWASSSVVQHVASVAAALGDGVCAGQFIICGSVTAPMFLETGETGIEWTLDPMRTPLFCR